MMKIVIMIRRICISYEYILIDIDDITVPLWDICPNASKITICWVFFCDISPFGNVLMYLVCTKITPPVPPVHHHQSIAKYGGFLR